MRAARYSLSQERERRPNKHPVRSLANAPFTHPTSKRSVARARPFDSIASLDTHLIKQPSTVTGRRARGAARGGCGATSEERLRNRCGLSLGKNSFLLVARSVATAAAAARL